MGLQLALLIAVVIILINGSGKLSNIENASMLLVAHDALHGLISVVMAFSESH